MGNGLVLRGSTRFDRLGFISLDRLGLSFYVLGLSLDGLRLGGLWFSKYITSEKC